jgi:hypothetical protein
MEEIPVFRTQKKRKVARHRSESVEDPSDSDNDLEAGLDSPGRTGHETQSNIIRAQKFGRRIKGGITFSAAPRNPASTDQNLALTAAQPAEDKIKDMSSRFIGSTGQAVDVDKHMYVSPYSFPSLEVMRHCLTL